MSWLIPDDGWRERALCGNDDPEKFFPKGRPSNESRASCRDCQVRQECLEFALTSPWEPSGIWGGKTEREIRPEWLRRHQDRPTEIQSLLGIA